MGGYMTYHRMRNRNGLGWRPEGLLTSTERVNPYPMVGKVTNPAMLLGDLNRMERDMLGLNDWVNRQADGTMHPQAPLPPDQQCAEDLSLDVETVHSVLRWLFETP